MTDPRIIKNLLFDFGGVIIDIDFNRTIEAFRALGAESFDEKYGKAAQSGIFDELDRGHIQPDDFIGQLAGMLPPQITTKEITDAWNRIIIGIPEERMKLLQSVSQHYKTLLLSNTNSIHYELYIPQIQQQYNIRGLEDIFHHVFLSFKLGMRKPEEAIFNHVFEKTGLKREETLFIDDSPHIIEAARSYGIPCWWIEDGHEIQELFYQGRLREDLSIPG